MFLSTKAGSSHSLLNLTISLSWSDLVLWVKALLEDKERPNRKLLTAQPKSQRIVAYKSSIMMKLADVDLFIFVDLQERRFLVKTEVKTTRDPQANIQCGLKKRLFLI